ncbi:PadR family transcriptional regulator [Agromyces ramosus]|jgi:DNA-binding PadR family transcriptional regulator|uniref:PadR family transcriptional regulator n=1 Tax=Agromyces ramosus TaxID=33879 RepID=A0A4Q7MBL2_9MICO|nr:PadR family transcriptional regulator [Agromyces ramosus]RZS64757.1 PadR family transcriptional regulator [Agromyces ramosus]
MSRLNPLAVSALALLAERPMHPYEMYQLMLQRREDRVVKVSAGSLYRAVERLAADGDIAESGVEREGNRPERTVYTITASGRDALRSTLEQMLGEFVNEFPEFPVAIGEAHNLPPERVADLLDERAARIRDFADLLDTGLRHIAAKGVARYRVLNVHYTRAMVAAELDWLERTIAELRDGELTWAAPEQLAAASADPIRT